MTNPMPPGFEGPVCPLPLRHDQQIVLGHGSGGRMTHDLIQRVFLPALKSAELEAGNDFARLGFPDRDPKPGKLVVSTDAHIVSPLFFPGGDIGRLAVCGTVNDVSMSGAHPLFLTASFILEEGLPVEILQRIANSMQSAAHEAQVIFVAGDTKVVERGKGDGLFISTTGIGWLPDDVEIHGANARPGDAVILSGSLADHGIAVLSARGELGLVMDAHSDVAPLNGMINTLLAAVPDVHVLRDPTRGGLATTLNEIARHSGVEIMIDEKSVPIHTPIRSACEILGFDPFYVANEGKVVIVLPSERLNQALDILHAHPYGQDAAWIGEVKSERSGQVLLRTTIGSTRILDMLSGEMLPRIC